MVRNQASSQMAIRSYDGLKTLEELAAALSEVLVGQSVFYSVVDTGDTYLQQKMGFYAVTEPVTVSRVRHGAFEDRTLLIPISTGIRLSDATVATQPVIVEIFASSIRIEQPYYFGVMGLQWKLHAIALTGPIDQ